jgi:hypothetical protein
MERKHYNRATLRRSIRSTIEAGVIVDRVEIAPDGGVVLVAVSGDRHPMPCTPA